MEIDPMKNVVGAWKSIADGGSTKLQVGLASNRSNNVLSRWFILTTAPAEIDMGAYFKVNPLIG